MNFLIIREFCSKITLTSIFGIISTLPDKMDFRPRVVLTCEQKSTFLDEIRKMPHFTRFMKNSKFIKKCYNSIKMTRRHKITELVPGSPKGSTNGHGSHQQFYYLLTVHPGLYPWDVIIFKPCRRGQRAWNYCFGSIFYSERTKFICFQQYQFIKIGGQLRNLWEF